MYTFFYSTNLSNTCNLSYNTLLRKYCTNTGFELDELKKKRKKILATTFPRRKVPLGT